MMPCKFGLVKCFGDFIPFKIIPADFEIRDSQEFSFSLYVQIRQYWYKL